MDIRNYSDARIKMARLIQSKQKEGLPELALGRSLEKV
jgi:hypothetical protein